MRAFVITSVIFALLFCGCNGENPYERKGKVYWHSDDGTPTNLDPVQSATVYTNQLVTTVYDTLFDYKYLKRPYELKPILAESMPEVSEDGLVYTIKIKKGVFFIDDPAFPNGKGREVVANDVIYSVKRHFDPKNVSQGVWLWRDRIVGADDWGKREGGADYDAEIEGFKATDSHTIQLTLTKAYPQILYTFAMGFSAVVPREAVEHYGRRLSRHPVGSGPFMLESFDDTQAVLVKNPNYREEYMDIAYEGYDEEIHGFTGIKELDGKRIPFVDTIIFSFFTEPTARWNSFTKGNETQFCWIPIEQVDLILSSKQPPQLNQEYAEKYFMNAEREMGFVYAVFNMDDPEWGYNEDPKRNAMNKSLRQAFRKTFSWEQRVKRFYYGIGEAYPGVIPPGTAGYSELPKEYITRDVEGAKKLLKDAGWTAENLPVFEYASTSGTRYTQFFEQVRGWLVEIGYPREKIKHKTYANFGDYNKSMKEKKNMFNGLGWGLDYPDGENTMQLFYGPNEAPGSNNANFKHEEFDRLFKEAKPLPHCEERTELYRKMHEILFEEAVGVFGFSRTRLQVWHKDIIAYPTRQILNNFFRYVDVREKKEKQK